MKNHFLFTMKAQSCPIMSTLFCENFSLQALLVQKLKISTLDGAKLRNCRGATAKTAGVHFLIFGYFCRLGYISSYRWARVRKPRRNIINLASKSPLNTTLAPLISAPEGLRNILTLVMSWWGPTKVMTMIWAHLLIFVRCGLVILMLQAMLIHLFS